MAALAGSALDSSVRGSRDLVSLLTYDPDRRRASDAQCRIRAATPRSGN